MALCCACTLGHRGHAFARMYAHTHACTLARAQARVYASKHARTHARTPRVVQLRTPPIACEPRSSRVSRTGKCADCLGPRSLALLPCAL